MRPDELDALEPGTDEEPEHDPADDPRAAPRPDAPAAPEPIRLGQRALFVGMTGQGKSEAAASAWANHTGQRLLVDVQDHYELGPAARAEDPPPLEVDDPRAIDWRHRTIRYVVRRPGDRREMEALYAAIYRRGDLLVWCDEAEDVAPSSGGGQGVPFHVKKVVKQGRKRRLTHLACTQRPFGVDRSVINQSEHAFVFRMVDPDDLQTLSYRLGMSARELSAALEQLDEHEYLRHTLGSRHVIHMPPLPAEAVAFTRQHVYNPEHTRR